MDTYQCYKCGWITDDHTKSLQHMEAVHHSSLKEEKGTEKIVCDIWRFKCNNVAEIKVHLIEIHKKEEWNWMTEDFRIKFSCNECELDFVTKILPNDHALIVHEEKTDTTEEDLDRPTEYKLKPWGADENEGYLFEGKRDSFSEAHSKLK